MKNLYCTFLMVFLAALRLSAVPVTVSGQVNFEDGSPAAGWPVFIGAVDPNGNGNVAITDPAGFYELIVDLPAGDTEVQVETFDNCGPLFEIAAISNGEAVANFVLCNDMNWPDCFADAFFDLQQGLTVQFYGQGYAPDSSVTFSYEWDLGDGTTSTEQNPIHTYGTPGDYIVTLNVSSPDCSTSITLIVPVFEAQDVTVFGQVVDQNGNGVPGWPVFVLTANPNFPGDAITDPQGNYSATVPLPTNATEATAETFDMCSPAGLVTRTSPIVNGSAEINFQICFDSFPPPPDCGAYITYNHVTGLTYEFFANTYAADSTVTFTYEWDFGDGTTSTEQNPTHTYADDGIYTVLLTVTSSNGCVIHACEVICTHNGGFIDSFYYDCQAMFAVTWGGPDPAGNFDPFTLNFVDLSFGVVVEWLWDFGDGTTSTEQNPTHTYADAGLYSVSLQITTVDGCQSAISFEVYVGDNFPWTEYDCQAMFLPIPDSTGNGYFFLDLSVTNSPIQSWLWDFGDGTTSTEQNPNHVYAAPGLYTVTLTIEADSCNSTISFELDTSDPFHGPSTPGAVLGLGTGLTSTTVLPSLQKVAAYPNPVQSTLTVTFDSPDAQDVALQISDLSGRALRNQNLTAAAGLNVIPVLVEALTPGLYLVQLRTASGIQALKFVKE